MTSTESHAIQGRLGGNQSNRASRYQKAPDWNSFYKNGLPREVIVIDDTPEPDHEPPPTSNGYLKKVLDHGQTEDASRKRKRQDAGAESLYYTSTLDSQSYRHDSRSIPDYDTAPTTPSLSNGHTDDSSSRTGQKRKRTRLQQVVSETSIKKEKYQSPPRPIKKAAEVNVRVVRDDAHKDKKIKVDDDDGHYIIVPESSLTTQYRITKLLGQGTFGKVVQAHDRTRDQPVAIKVIRSIQKYRDASRIELRVLKTLRQNDASNRYRCIHLRDCFDFRGHICIVTDLLDSSLFDFLKGNCFVPFPNSHIQAFARQLLTSVAYLHDLNLIHTDLKPENILLCNAAYQTFTYNRKIPSSQVTTARRATQRKVLLDPEIKLIDFGSATFQDEYHSSVVSTRHYRAPEIILGLGWSFPCDIWSIGCILVEFFTGDALFQTHDNLEHLAMMEVVCSSRIDTQLVQKVNSMSTRSGGSNSASKYFKRLKLDYPTPDTTRASRRFVKNMKKLGDIVPSTNPFLRNFLDLLEKMFVYDPAHRITAKEALDHPWFREVSEDDGTEAAKILMERKATSQQNGRSSTINLT